MSGRQSVREIRTSAYSGGHETRALLQSLFAAEVLSPSRCLWIVSPWVSDLGIIDNSAGTFGALDPAWPAAPVRLTRVLLHMLKRGSTVVVATRPATYNDDFVSRITEAAAQAGVAERLQLHRAGELHEKGVLGDSFFLSGSMNFTPSGIEINEELIRFETDSAVVAATALDYFERWGGVLRAA